MELSDVPRNIRYQNDSAWKLKRITNDIFDDCVTKADLYSYVEVIALMRASINFYATSSTHYLNFICVVY